MERLRDYVHVASANLQATPLRSLLSVLGIVVGTASVISVLALGAGARKDLVDSVTKQGAEVFRVTSQYDERLGESGDLDFDSLRDIRAAPFVINAFADLEENVSVRSRFDSIRATVVPIDADYLRLTGTALESGREFNPVDSETRRLVCLIDQTAAQILFPNGIPSSGADIFAFKTRWEVVGTFSSERATPRIFVPLTSYMRHTVGKEMKEIVVYVASAHEKTAKSSLMDILTHGNPAKEKSFAVSTDRERIAQRLENRRLLFKLWTAIAYISLLVGGIGMMNVMLTSVAERTREIGLRRAIGARRKDILIQFLVEACILNVLGGILGLFVGAAVARVLPLLLTDFGIRLAVMEPSFAIGTVALSVGMGIVFGLYPAIRAAAFSPAEALRSD